MEVVKFPWGIFTRFDDGTRKLELHRFLNVKDAFELAMDERISSVEMLKILDRSFALMRQVKSTLHN